MATLNGDGAAKLKIIIAEDHSYGTQIKIKDSVTNVYQEFAGAWKLVIAYDEYGEAVVETLLDGEGFTISEDLFTLTIDVPTVLNLVPPGSYFYDLRGDEGGYSKRPLKGIFLVNPVISKP